MLAPMLLSELLRPILPLNIRKPNITGLIRRDTCKYEGQFAKAVLIECAAPEYGFALIRKPPFVAPCLLQTPPPPLPQLQRLPVGSVAMRHRRRRLREYWSLDSHSC